jgi:hypothetical protein
MTEMNGFGAAETAPLQSDHREEFFSNSANVGVLAG